MKKLFGNNVAPAAEERITDAMLGTGEHMCTCAALVADIIIEQEPEKVSLKELLGRIGADAAVGGSAAENKL